MRAYALRAGEVIDNPGAVLVVDLDSIVMFKEGPSPAATYWTVTLSSGDHLSLTKAAYDRVVIACKAK
jgi:hypothetical protein